MRPGVDVRHQPAAARTSITSIDGSGTAAFAMAPEPLPAVWPKWAPSFRIEFGRSRRRGGHWEAHWMFPYSCTR